MFRTTTLFAVLASISLSAQTTPAPAGMTVTIAGCLAQAQRDGSLGQRASGVTATPETAANEANNPEPTNRYVLTSATPSDAARLAADKPPASGAAATGKTTYALRGHEKELATHVGHRVQIEGSLQPPLVAKVLPKDAATAEGIRTVQVTSVKMLGSGCSITVNPPPTKSP